MKSIQHTYDLSKDPAPDVFTVKQLSNGRLRIGHYKSVIEKRECCCAEIDADALGRPLKMPCGADA